MQRVEIGDAVSAEHHGLAVDDELLLLILERGFDNPWISLGPVIAVAADQAHARAVALDAQAVTVIFYFVQPVRAVRNTDGLGGKAKIKRLKHAAKIGSSGAFCEGGTAPERGGTAGAVPDR